MGYSTVHSTLYNNLFGAGLNRKGEKDGKGKKKTVMSMENAIK